MLKSTNFANIKYVCKDNGDIVGILMNPGKYQKAYYVGDTVKVTDDGHGYICPGVRTPGVGKIVKIREDSTDHFFIVRMKNGEEGFMKAARLEVIDRVYQGDAF